MHIGDAVSLADQVKHQGCGNVVGEVADNPQLLAVHGQLAEIKLQGVALVQGEQRAVPEARQQQGMQIVVEFNHIELCTTAQQTLGNGALSWANFNQMLAFARTDRAQDTIDHARIMQEVLTKALARPVGGKVTHVRAPAFIMLMAVSSATRRLPGSARPVPARSRAVP